MAEDYADPEDINEPVDNAEEDAAERKKPTAAKLLSFLDNENPNLATTLDEDQLTDIATKVIEGYELDDGSREDWKKRNEEGLKLASLFIDGPKDSPFPGASNVKAPLITTAALQFNARAYPALIKTDRVAKGKVNGHDPKGEKAKRAERVSEHMSWQLLTEMPEWEEDTDRLTLIVAISGVIFRKHYWDPALGRQCSRLILADRFVYNYKARSIEDCPRISEELPLYPSEIEERIRDGRFLDFDYEYATPDENGKTDEDGPQMFIEQHRLLDLDGDGYGEPYVVTVHKEQRKVCRIVPNFDHDSVRVTEDGRVAAIRKREYYTKFVFFQSPDGGAYGMGLGSLMGATTEAVNTVINEMIDSGHLANTQGGFISSSAGIREKSFKFSRGEFKVVNTSGIPMSQAIMPMSFPGPAPTLFQLLGLLMEFAKDISSTKDVMTGDTGGKVMAPTTTLALIEQGMQVFSAIFKRLHKAMGKELQLHARLNYENLTPEAYNAFFDDAEQQYDPKADYDLKSMDITPVSDPSVATSMQKMAKAQVAREIGAGKPWINQPELDRRAFEAAEVPDIDKLFVPPPQPDAKLEAFKEAIQNMTLLELKTKIEKLETEATKNDTASLLNIASAAAAEAGEQSNAYLTLLKFFEAEHNMEQGIAGQQAGPASGPGGLPGMAGEPSDPMGNGAPEGAGDGLGGVGAGAGIPTPDIPASGPIGPDSGATPPSAPQGAM
jgi:chaperonin GroES